MDREASNVHLTKMCSVLLMRCLPKMPSSSLTSTDSQIATWRRSLTWTTSQVRLRSSTTIDGKDVCLTTGVSSPNPVQCNILPHHHSQLSHLTMKLYSTTSLKSISLKRWIYHQMFKLSSDQFNSQIANHVISHSSFWLVNRITADEYRCYDHKYVNIHRHQLLIFTVLQWTVSVKSIMNNRWQWLSFNAKLACN